MEDKIKELE